MSTRKQAVTVSREYRAEPDHCVRALVCLLKKPVNNEGSPTLATLDDTRGKSKNDSRTKPILPR